MAISCTKCSRQYDVMLFQFGRTVNCACGERVWLEHRLNLPLDSEIRFFADVNVASVVRWLRAIGLDTVWEDAIPDDDLVRRGAEERRFVLTLDKRILEEFRTDHVFLLSTNEPIEQFAEIIRRFTIQQPTELFKRCLVCNTILRETKVGQIAEQAPPSIREIHTKFQFCPTCSKVYWEGSHTQRMREAIEKVFSE
ncbi:MAG: Mut7-C RNAse domain-containing protein [Pyrinomonadaceae bacterium]|nr:Mut7-C RNAse domain-containing protein [Pyrinomonadaceae bacterium]